MRDYARRDARLSAASLKLFFALWPDSGTRDVLAATAGVLRRTCGGRAPPAHNLHLTLAFLGNVPAARLPELEDLAAAVHTEPFVLELDRIGWWQPECGAGKWSGQIDAHAQSAAVAREQLH